jgi:hypothetical protein
MPKCHLCPNNFAKYENPFLLVQDVDLSSSVGHRPTLTFRRCLSHYDMLCSSQAYIISDLGRRHFLLNRNNIKYIQIISVILFS